METTKETSAVTNQDLIITRVFESGIQKVWKAWTSEAGLRKWWGPKDFTAPRISLDFKVGGKYLFCMRSPDGKDFWTTGTFREIQSGKKIVFSDSFSDANGNIVPASAYGMPDADNMEITVGFQEVNGKTWMTLKHTGLPAAMIDDCRLGWNESLDKLENNIK